MYRARKLVKFSPTLFGFPGSAETPARWGGKLNHRFKPNFLRNISAKNYQNATTFHQATADDSGDVFFTHGIKAAPQVAYYPPVGTATATAAAW